jgi:hypothetical protein
VGRKLFASLATAVASLSFAASAFAIVAVQSGPARMEMVQVGFWQQMMDSPNLGDSALYTTNGAPDQLYKYTWYYKTPLNTIRPIGQTSNPVVTYPDPTTARIAFMSTGVSGAVFDAVFYVSIFSGRGDSASVTTRVELTPSNTNWLGSQTIQLYQLVDLDVGGNGNGNDTALRTSNAGGFRFKQTDDGGPNVAEFWAPGANYGEVNDSTFLRYTRFATTSQANLDTNMTNAYGDVGIAAQWSVPMVQGQTKTLSSVFAIGQPAAFVIPEPSGLAGLLPLALVLRRRR